ncbi:MAG: PhnD/SsuA/transferrin family substrate-binding protein, partial [Anaerolineae bacterium]|nr:PhnD/SsuA/transferrin family substrate-binding protein [Anaerolineae bacterium]
MWSKRDRMRGVVLIILAVAMLLAGCAQQSGPAKSELVFSPPLLGAGDFPKLREPAQQVASQIAAASGIKVGVYVPTDYGNTLLGLSRGEIDIAYVPMGLYPRAVADAGAKAAFFVTVNGETTEDSAIYVKSDSGLGGMADLA